MKNIFLLLAFCFFAFAPTSNIAAQKSFGEELLEAFVVGVIEGLLEGATSTDEEVTIAEESNQTDIEGVWKNSGSMLILSERGSFSEMSPNGEIVAFQGNYQFEDGILNILEYDGTVNSRWRISFNGAKMTLSWTGKSPLTYTYVSTCDEHFDRKDREIANLTANTHRNTTMMQSEILSKGIRLDIQRADMRRSYDTERIQALEYAKQWRQLGNEAQAQAWEKKADDCANEIKRLDDND